MLFRSESNESHFCGHSLFAISTMIRDNCSLMWAGSSGKLPLPLGNRNMDTNVTSYKPVRTLSLKNQPREFDQPFRSKHFHSGDHFIHSHNLFLFKMYWCCWEKTDVHHSSWNLEGKLIPWLVLPETQNLYNCRCVNEIDASANLCQ